MAKKTELRVVIRDGDLLYPIKSDGRIDIKNRGPDDVRTSVELETEDLYGRLKEMGVDVVMYGREVEVGEYAEYEECPGGFKRRS
tara:strand:+ start:654 stop:908 length:255 start_codon:yes stop_codon:yes gene_type:complete